METYEALCERLVQDSGIAAQVLLTDDDTMCLFWRCLGGLEGPTPLTFCDRPVRIAGVVGTLGATPSCALVEPLPDDVMSAVSMAFAAYVNTINGTEIAELERWLLLPDTRT